MENDLISFGKGLTVLETVSTSATPAVNYLCIEGCAKATVTSTVASQQLLHSPLPLSPEAPVMTPNSIDFSVAYLHNSVRDTEVSMAQCTGHGCQLAN